MQKAGARVGGGAVAALGLTGIPAAHGRTSRVQAKRSRPSGGSHPVACQQVTPSSVHRRGNKQQHRTLLVLAGVQTRLQQLRQRSNIGSHGGVVGAGSAVHTGEGVKSEGDCFGAGRWQQSRPARARARMRRRLAAGYPRRRF